ncbi:MAG: DUF4388 domain-containing protein [Thermoanaerobaculia bacterium]|nr:DUF4388 domain-containing protein [Thermoanaerobaculia bacterium]
MSISGDLLDVSVAEVMQFVHLGRRTGTLKVTSGERRAEIGFHRGRIISAWTPEAKRLGELLVQQEIIDAGELEEILARQQQVHPRPSLGRLLVESGAIDDETLRSVVGRQIEHTVYQLVSWKEGNFEFALDELRPIDDVGVYPGDILPDINLDTQMVVLDALRIFDEKNRSRQAAAAGRSETGEGEGGAGQPSAADELAELFQDDGGKTSREEGAPPLRLQLLTEDEELLELLRDEMPAGEAVVSRVDPRDAGLTLPGEAPPVVLVDQRNREDLELLESVGRARPRAAVLAVMDPWAAPARAYEVGALAVLPPDVKAIATCVRSLIKARDSLTDPRSSAPVRSGFAKLRRVVADLRSGLLSATVALNLMQVISESVERAILFLVQEDHLLALGAFGAGPDGEPLAQRTSGIAIPLGEGGALTEAVDHGQTRSLMFDDADLPGQLTERVGRPRTGQVVIFPVLGSASVFSVVYADNGTVSREIEEIEILELAAAQVGVAFENEILRRRMDRLRQREASGLNSTRG